MFQPIAVFILFDTQIVSYVVSESPFKLDPVPFYPVLFTLIASLLPGVTVYSKFILYTSCPHYSVWWEMVLKDQTGTPAVHFTTGLFLQHLVERARLFFLRESVSGVHIDISNSV